MNFFKRVSILVAAWTVISFSSFGQDDIEQLLKESKDDGIKLINGYIAPFMKPLSLGLNQGWYNTAKPHKIAGVDLTVTVNAMTIPSSERFYNVSKLNLQQIELAPSQPAGITNGNVPTLVGPDIRPTYQLKSDPSQQFTAAGGIDLKKNIKMNALPVPMAQLGFGLPKNTDIKIRFTPSIDLGSTGSVKLFGIGVMHDVKQYIPGIKLMPFDLSAFVGYTHLKLTTDLSETPGQNQQGVYEVSATTIQGLISKKFSVLTVYGGVGYNIAKSNLAMKGSYDLDSDGTMETKDPVDLKFAASGLRMTAGVRLKLGPITLHSDYTLQKYKALSVGFGINVR